MALGLTYSSETTWRERRRRLLFVAPIEMSPWEANGTEIRLALQGIIMIIVRTEKPHVQLE
jgi:hypothetical protein